jgi:hypothetical protein
MRFQHLLCAAGLAAAVAGSASAEVVDLRFQERPGVGAGYQIYGDYLNTYLDYQLAFRDAADNGDFDFHFTYDTESLAPDYGLALVSGRVGSFTDFSGFSPHLAFSPSSGLTISLNRSDQPGAATFTTGVYFVMVDDDGDIPAALPTSLDIAAMDQANASFETRRSGGVGLGYWNVYYAGFDGTVEVPAGSGEPPGGGPVSPAPEPSAWALMILGFGAAGALLRRRSAAQAASNCSAASRA